MASAPRRADSAPKAAAHEPIDIQALPIQDEPEPATEANALRRRPLTPLPHNRPIASNDLGEVANLMGYLD